MKNKVLLPCQLHLFASVRLACHSLTHSVRKCTVLFFFFFFAVNVDEWLKSANSLSPNDMEAGDISLLVLIHCAFVFQDFLRGTRAGTLVRALSSHQCGLG